MDPGPTLSLPLTVWVIIPWWAGTLHVYGAMYPGVTRDVFFSSPSILHITQPITHMRTEMSMHAPNATHHATGRCRTRRVKLFASFRLTFGGSVGTLSSRFIRKDSPRWCNAECLTSVQSESGGVSAHRNQLIKPNVTGQQSSSTWLFCNIWAVISCMLWYTSLFIVQL